MGCLVGMHISTTWFYLKVLPSELTILLDELGRNVFQFIYFKEIESLLGFLHMVEADKDGYAIPKCYFSLQKE